MRSRRPFPIGILASVALIATLALSACAPQAVATTATPASTGTPTPPPIRQCSSSSVRNATLTSGTASVIFPGGDIAKYIEDATTHPSTDLGALWMRDVIDNLTPKARFSFDSASNWTVASRQVDVRTLACVIQDTQAADVADIAMGALTKARAALASAPAQLVILPFPLGTRSNPASIDPAFRSFLFTTGFSGPGAIRIECWEPTPTATSAGRAAQSGWTDYLPGSVYHEYFEVFRYARYTEAASYKDLLSNMITDGMAESFKAAMTGHASQFDTTLTPQQEATVWAYAQPYLHSSDSYYRSHVMGGDPRTGIPQDAGYTIGYHIVRDYLKRHPGTSFATLAGLSMETVFSGSGYAG
jgi:hypothetical protein